MEEKFKTPEYQRRASKKWKDKNVIKNKRSSYRSSARLYAREYAESLEDIKELEEIFKKENKNYKGEIQNNE